MNRLSAAKRAAVVWTFCEGMSIRATGRMTGVAKHTIFTLLADVGDACTKYQNKHVVGLKTEQIQCDERWSFCSSKQGNTTCEIRQRQPNAGDVGTCRAMDPLPTRMRWSSLGGEAARVHGPRPRAHA